VAPYLNFLTFCGEECGAMQDHVYKVIELVGSSETSIEDAVQGAIGRAAQTLKHLRWFEIVQTRGHIEEGKVRHYQVTLKAGFTLEDTR
jgi:flavin-binding protein dodecin